MTSVESQAGSTPQARNNLSTWARGQYLSTYATHELRPVEVKLLVRYHRELEGRVLELGCGGGRLLGFLATVCGEVTGIDLAETMVEHCRATVPDATVLQGDLSALASLVDTPFDVIFAIDNLLDIFGDAERREALRTIREALAPGGLLIFSSHDLAWSERNPGPREWEIHTKTDRLRSLLERSPADVARALARRRRVAANRRRLGPLQEHHDGYAILNDTPHDYSLLHYYIRRDDQERQLGETGFELLECYGFDGRPVGPGGSGPDDSLHYIARRV